MHVSKIIELLSLNSSLEACSVKMAGYWPCSFFFLRVYGPRLRRGHKRTKKNDANIQPS